MSSRTLSILAVAAGLVVEAVCSVALWLGVLVGSAAVLAVLGLGGLGWVDAVLCLGLAICAVVDARRMIIPDFATYFLMIFGVLVSLFPATLGGVCGVYGSVAGLVVGYGFVWGLRQFYFVFRGVEAMGLGDAKLLGAAGAWVGVWHLPWVVLAASAGALMFFGFTRLCLAGAGNAGANMIAFGPFIALAFWGVWHVLPPL